MADPSGALVNIDLGNLGDLAKPATVLVEKISDAIGKIFLPSQIERVAKANAKADKIKAVSTINIDQLQRRALARLLKEESDKQKNIESITQKALPQLTQASNPKDVERDWIVNFFDKAKLISDSKMQDIWSRILSGEANTPGIFSKRTVNLLSSLDKRDALLFNKLFLFMWRFEKELIPVVFDSNEEIYNKNGIYFDSLKHLDSIGLISFEALGGYTLKDLPQKIKISYMKRFVDITFLNNEKNKLNIGLVMLTNVGQELANILTSVNSIDGFFDYVVKKWSSEGNMVVS